VEYQEYVEQTESIDKLLARRCYAAIVDYALFFAVFYIDLRLFGEYQPDGSLMVHGSGHLFAMLCVWMLFFPSMESKFGFTLGKGLFDLKVEYQDKKAFRFPSSLKRHLLDIIDFQFFGLIAILMVKFTHEHKRMGDRWGDTTVVKDDE
jgi:uncharacterized RDD family membrane protein YckC